MSTKTATLDVPGAVVTYDIHEPVTASDARPLFVIGSPMGAAGFATLASHFTDRTVITYDPPGMERSTVTGTGPDPDPLNRGAALHAIAEAAGLGPYDLFGNSGGAVDGLAWVQQFPDDVVVAVLHEPPLPAVLPDAEVATAVMDDIHATYQARGFGPGMAKFLVAVMTPGELAPEFLAQPAPDPAAFGLPTEDDGVRGDALLGVNMKTMQHWHPDLEALRSVPTRILPAYGAESGPVLGARGAHGLAEALGVDAVELPGDHGGFLGGEYGQTGKPTEFAQALRALL